MTGTVAGGDGPACKRTGEISGVSPKLAISRRFKRQTAENISTKKAGDIYCRGSIVFRAEKACAPAPFREGQETKRQEKLMSQTGSCLKGCSAAAGCAAVCCRGQRAVALSVQNSEGSNATTLFTQPEQADKNAKRKR
jgi:hypothetical protein